MDGIKNSQDACQNTPVGETDTRGCSWMTYDGDQDGVLNGQDECMNTYNSKQGEIDENGCWVVSDDGSSGIGFLIFIILGVILVVLLVSRSNRSDSDGISIDGMKVLSVAGKIAGGAAGVFTGMHQLARKYRWCIRIFSQMR